MQNVLQLFATSVLGSKGNQIKVRPHGQGSKIGRPLSRRSIEVIIDILENKSARA
jgi:hypothetical protein